MVSEHANPLADFGGPDAGGQAADLAVRGGCSYVHHDVIDPFPDIGPVDLVVHLACPPSPSYYVEHPIATMRCTADETRHALEAALRGGARFLLASTSEADGDPAEHPQSEAYWGNVNPIGPRRVYDEGKRYAEALTMAYVREHRVNAVIARIFNTYGPRMRVDEGRMIPTFITHGLNDEPLPVYGTGQQTRSLCHVDDTVAGLLALATSTERDPGPVNIGNPEEVTVNHVARTIARPIRESTTVRRWKMIRCVGVRTSRGPARGSIGDR